MSDKLQVYFPATEGPADAPVRFLHSPCTVRKFITVHTGTDLPMGRVLRGARFRTGDGRVVRADAWRATHSLCQTGRDVSGPYRLRAEFRNHKPGLRPRPHHRVARLPRCRRRPRRYLARLPAGGARTVL